MVPSDQQQPDCNPLMQRCTPTLPFTSSSHRRGCCYFRIIYHRSPSLLFSAPCFCPTCAFVLCLLSQLVRHVGIPFGSKPVRYNRFCAWRMCNFGSAQTSRGLFCVASAMLQLLHKAVLLLFLKSYSDVNSVGQFSITARPIHQRPQPIRRSNCLLCLQPLGYQCHIDIGSRRRFP